LRREFKLGQQMAAWQQGGMPLPAAVAPLRDALNDAPIPVALRALLIDNIKDHSTMADAMGASPEFPDMLDVVARAKELDAFAQPLDAQLSLVLRARSVAWSLGYVQQTAARHGFIPGVLPGRMVLPGAQDGDPPVLVLSFDAQVALADDPQNAALYEVQLSLDVVQTEESAEPFPAWHRAATALAGDMDGWLVDDQGRAVTLHAFDEIGKELQVLYRTLESRDLAAGSPAARRLFS
jgi:hypothetical protein